MPDAITDIEVGLVRPNPRQPRRHFGDLQALAQSLRERGQVSPIIVRPVPGGYELVCGERRWRAAQLAGLSTVKAEVRELSDREAFRLSLVENLQREDLTPLEEAEAFASLLADGMTQAEVGALVGKGQSYVAHKLRLLKAPEPVKAFIAQGALTEGHLRQLLKLEGLYLPSSGIVWDNCQVPAELTASYLAAYYNGLRPEENPPVPLWCYPEKRIARCPWLDTLVESCRALLEYVTRHSPAPQWVIAAWWWGAAAVVYELPVEMLARAIDTWFERYQAGAVELHLKPKPPVPEGKGKWDAWTALWWCHWADLRHSGSLETVGDGLLSPEWMMEALKRVIKDGPALPSSMQPWGSMAETGRRLVAPRG